MNELHLFAGAGGGILGGQLLGHSTVCAVEIEPYPRAVLVARQNDGTFPPFPIWDDVRTFDGKPWRGIVDVVAGGFPCQDISAAGRGAGISGARSGLWSEFARIIGEVRPRYAFIENSPMLVTRGLSVVLSDLAKMGYDAEWGCLSAAQVGANHKRDRIWLLARRHNDVPHTKHGWIGRGQQQQESIKEETNAELGNARMHGQLAAKIGDGFTARGDDNTTWTSEACKPARSSEQYAAMADTDSAQRERNECTVRSESQHADIGRASWWQAEPDVGRVVNGMAFRTDRLKAIGNGQVPLCAATAFTSLMGRFT